MGRFTPILCPFWPLGCPKMGKILDYGENGCHHHISHVYYHIRPNLQVSMSIFEEIGTFTPFCAPFDPWGAPKWVKYWSMVKINATINFPMLNSISEQICRISWSFSEKLCMFIVIGHLYRGRSRDITSAIITSEEMISRPCFLYEFSSASNFLSRNIKHGHIWTL